MALQISPATCRYPGVIGLYRGPPGKGGLELGPTRNQTNWNRTRIQTRNQTRTEPEFEFSAKRR